MVLSEFTATLANGAKSVDNVFIGNSRQVAPSECFALKIKSSSESNLLCIRAGFRTCPRAVRRVETSGAP